MNVHLIFRFTVVDRSFAALVSLYLAIEFNDVKSGSAVFPCCNCSNNAPNNALVAGGYFKAKRNCAMISLPIKFLMIAKKHLQDTFTLASGIFLCCEWHQVTATKKYSLW
ncbi:MAG: hypothetical protein K9I36_09435 [Bacteroidia bacterium]|nr:hypothetical protein [Bacteroidia bacterium]